MKIHPRRRRKIGGWQRRRRVKSENKQNGRRGKKIDLYQSRKAPRKQRLPSLQ